MSDTLIEAVARAAAVQMTSLQGSERNMDADLTPNERKFYLPIARASIAAIEASGYRIVPVKLTEDMACAGESAWGSEPQWAAMLAAAPKVIR